MKLDYVTVTQALYPFSGIKDIPNQKAVKRAADRGSLVHRLCGGEISGLGSISTEIQVKEYLVYEGLFGSELQEQLEKEMGLVNGFMQSFDKWVDAKIFIKPPERLVCDEHRLTGLPDELYVEQGSPGYVLVDFKCPQQESKTWRAQASGYDYLCEKNGYPIIRKEWVKLDRKGGIPQIYTYQEKFDYFLPYLNLFRKHFKEQDAFVLEWI